MKISGSCLCNAVGFSFETEAPPRATWCHCTLCQKCHGTGLLFAHADPSALTWHDKSGLVWYETPLGNRRGFCGTCGATLFYHGANAPHISITAGCLDAPAPLSVQRHIFVADKGDHYELANDGLPRHPQWYDGRLTE